MASPDSPTGSDTLVADRSVSRTPSNGETRRHSILEWTMEETADFISSLGLGQYHNTFIDNEVEGRDLVHLNHELLKDMSVDSVGHRIMILKNVYNIKIADGVPIEQDHYVPISADASASQQAPPTHRDIERLVGHIRLQHEEMNKQSEEISYLKNENRQIKQTVEKLRDELLPLVRLLKEREPLPTPLARAAPPELHTITTPLSYMPSDNAATPISRDRPQLPEYPAIKEKLTIPPAALDEPKSTGGLLSRKPSRRGLWLNNPKSKSPTHPPYDSSKDYDLASQFNGLGPTNNNLSTTLSSSYAIPSPTSPVPTLSTTAPASQSRVYDDNPFPAGMFGSSGTSSSSQTTPKSFRVAMDDPCEKVLPAALRRYNIQADWRQYSLYIVYGDQERCLELYEKPLKMFKDLDREGKKPMFMLRRKAQDAGGVGTALPGGPGTGITLGLPGGIL